MIRRSGHGLLFVFHALEAKEILQPGFFFELKFSAAPSMYNKCGLSIEGLQMLPNFACASDFR
jgi:hypothetical protein